MKDLIKEVALSVWASQENAADTRSGDQIITEFATAFLVELSKRAEAVATLRNASDGFRIDNHAPDILEAGTKLFTFPPIHDIEAIENRVAEACAKSLSPLKNHYIESPGHSDREKALLIAAIDDATELLRSGEWGKHK